MYIRNCLRKTGLVLLVLVLVGIVSVADCTAQETLKAGFIYIDPIEETGFTYAHEQGRKYVEELFPWLETVYVENVSKSECEEEIDRLIMKEDADIVFTASFSFMDPTIAAAESHPDTLFFNSTGYKTRPNVGIYFSELFQLFYLNGVIAGGLTESGILGFVGAHPTSEVKRNVNAFTIGVREVNPEAIVRVRWTNEWYDPAAAREAAEELIEGGVDGLAFHTDSPAVLKVAQEHDLFGFSHGGPMFRFAEDAAVSGQLANWGPIYADILYKTYYGIYTNQNLDNIDYWWMLREGAAKLGAKESMMINPKYLQTLNQETVEDSIFGEISVYQLLMNRLEQMSAERVLFDPFEGPLYDREGNLWLEEGYRASQDELWSMERAVEGIEGNWPLYDIKD